ncbi:DUF4369 domain-containing protein [Algoriphagus lutimaris]|uniref:DUF4369 domain-containing protein n=1 Tax=Algoriphagus lutimaris TaxID=613197 RepID=UPI00196AFD84|nr:DUF4369 domain-containing protein [Algoriphagus lutimaris]MBN3519226.1 DUF4369 domain-containing protein [Algoriphagus lutimaris]
MDRLEQPDLKKKKMNTFKLMLATVLLHLIGLISYAQSGFQVNGKVQGLNADSLTVLHFDTPSSPRFEKIPALNGDFQFSGKAEFPYFVQVLYLTEDGTNRKLTEFILENSDLFIFGETPHFDSVRVVGSTSNTILKSYLEEDKALLKHWDDLKEVYDQAKESGNLSTAGIIAKKLNQITQVDRKALLKEYVEKHKEQMIAALLPNFCLLANQLTIEDYSDLYASLSIPIQQSIYGQELLHKSKLK